MSTERRINSAEWDRLFTRSEATGRSLQTRVREMIVTAIAEGWLRPETPLPSSRALADNLSVARNTVLLAYQQLVDEGVLEARARSGYFVHPEATPLHSGITGRDQAQDAGVDWDARLRAHPSQQRNIVKPREWNSYPYPFIYGQFDSSIFPTNDWRECVKQAMSVMPPAEGAGAVTRRMPRYSAIRG